MILFIHISDNNIDDSNCEIIRKIMQVRYSELIEIKCLHLKKNHTRVTRWVSLMEHKLPTLPEHLNASPFF